MPKKDIHDLRCKIADQRQPEHAADLAKLQTAIEPSEHPYRDTVQTNCYLTLLRVPAFKWPCRGPLASGLKGGYLYHLRSLAGFISEIEIASEPGEPYPPNADPTINLGKIKHRISLLSATLSRQWLPLRHFAKGDYSTERSALGLATRRFTWWTDFPPRPTALVRDAHKLGVPRNSMTSECVILRCKLGADIRRKLHVPSVLDGFASEVFLASSYSDAPVAGKAIDIGVTPFVAGESEFVLGPVAAERLEVSLAQISTLEIEESQADTDNPTFLSALEDYYRRRLQ